MSTTAIHYCLNWLRKIGNSIYEHQTQPTCRRRSARRLAAENLEPRLVLSVDYVSGFALGVNQTGPIISDHSVDGDGNTYVVGTIQSTVDLDPSAMRADGSDVLTSNGNIDGFIAKYAPDNSLLWARKMGGADIWDPVSEGSNYDKATDLALDTLGNAYVIGNYFGPSSFGSLTLQPLANSVYQDTFVTKLNSAGEFLWARAAGNSGEDRVGDLAVDSNGSLVTTIFSGFAMETRRYSASGSLQWTKSINTGPSNPWGCTAESVDLDPSGNIVVSGNFSGTVDFNADPKKTFNVTGAAAPAGTSGLNRSVNAYVLKMSSTGTFTWVAPFVARTSENAMSFVKAWSVDVNTTGDVFVSGDFRGAVDINPSTTIDQRLDPGFVSSGFVARLGATGSLVWARSFGADLQFNLSDLKCDADGVYLGGTFKGNLNTGDANLSLSTAGDLDGVILHISNGGDTDWVQAISGTGTQTLRSLDIAPDGTLSIVGNYSSTSVDFDGDGIPDLPERLTGYTTYIVKLRRR